ncbi:hypothetical protein D3C76_1026580 [compost metagenome]
MADPVHPVVPVARADQGQAVAAALQAVFDGPYTMLIEAFFEVRFARQVVVRLLPGIERAAFKVAHGLGQHAEVASDADIVTGRQRQPQIIVGTAAAHTAIQRRVPPMLHVAFGILMGRTQQQVGTHAGGIGMEHRHAVLQLIAKADGAAGLIVATAGLEATGDHLVHQPAIDHHIDARVGGLDLDHVQLRTPMLAYRFELRGGRGQAAVLMNQAQGGRRVPGCTEAEDHVLLFTAVEVQGHLDRRARIEAATGAARQACLLQSCRCLEAAVAADELGAIAADAGVGRVGIEERHPFAKLDRIGVPGEECAAGGVGFRHHMHRRFAAQVAQHPLDIAGRRQAPWAA